MSALSHRVLVKRAGLEVLWQWTAPPLPGDIFRALAENLKIPDLTLKLENNRTVNIKGERLSPLILKVFEALKPALADQGLFLVTAAMKPGSS